MERGRLCYWGWAATRCGGVSPIGERAQRARPRNGNGKRSESLHTELEASRARRWASSPESSEALLAEAAQRRALRSEARQWRADRKQRSAASRNGAEMSYSQRSAAAACGFFMRRRPQQHSAGGQTEKNRPDLVKTPKLHFARPV